MPSRRGFLRGLVGAAPGVATGVFIGVDTAAAGTKDKTAFNFTCTCGEGLVAEVPAVGETHKYDCACGTRWELEWTGNGFKTRNSRNRAEETYNFDTFVDKVQAEAQKGAEELKRGSSFRVE